MAVEALPTDRLAYPNSDAMLFGQALHPVTAGHGVVIGGGAVWPEVNFTLPPMLIREETLEQVRAEFRDMVTHILEKAVELQQPALVLEIEQLFELTHEPAWGALVTADVRDIMSAFYAKYGLRSALRVTVADIRELERPPRMRSGDMLGLMLEAFDRNAAAGADILAIESTGGKEVFDQAILAGDLEGIALGLGVLAPRDMRHLWGHISAIAARHDVVSGGDTACGFGNTAMQLAHQKMVPTVLAATVRLMTATRSLGAVQAGARGPLKDCGYENPIIQAIAGGPIAMEGKASACAHSSPLGNIAAAVCDLWSNESVQNVRLLSGYAPEVFTEILIYDARQMNLALQRGQGPWLRDLFVDTDRNLDAQAIVMDPKVMYAAAERLVNTPGDDYARTVALGRFAVETLRTECQEGRLALSKREERWLERIGTTLTDLPPDVAGLRERTASQYGALYRPEEYGL
jgi:methanol---5-hydroxybenzimidazolylcobamide Co-methyltransferase